MTRYWPAATGGPRRRRGRRGCRRGCRRRTGRTAAYLIQPASVSTSTSGSSQSIPAEPLWRTVARGGEGLRRPRRRRRVATSQGTQTVVGAVHGRGRVPRQPGSWAPRPRSCRDSRFVPSAQLPGQKTSPTSTSPPAGNRACAAGYETCADRLAGLAAAHLDPIRGRGCAGSVMKRRPRGRRRLS